MSHTEPSTEIIDIETYAKTERPVPHRHRYRIRIGREHFVVDVPCMTGREILALVDKTPEEFLLSQRFHGGKVETIGPDEKVDFTQPGVERFMTLPLDPTEGSCNEAAT